MRESHQWIDRTALPQFGVDGGHRSIIEGDDSNQQPGDRQLGAIIEQLNRPHHEQIGCSGKEGELLILSFVDVVIC